jgi:hypothetical protein
MGKVYKFTEEEINQMVKMYVKDFVSTNDIAKFFNVDPSVIVARLNKIGVKIAKGSAYSKEYWLERGMKEELIKNHIKTLRPINKEYWMKLGFSEEEAKLQIEGQKLVTLRGCIVRFGEEEGTKIWNGNEFKRSEKGKKGSAGLNYWLNKGYTLEEAKIKRSERQSTFSKEKCLKQYGIEKGLKVFSERQNKWQKSLYRNGNLKSGYSKISQDLFFHILKEYTPLENNKINFALHNGEYSLCDDSKFFRFDFTDLNSNKIIEYNGDDYHGNPKKYLAEDRPNPFRKELTAKEIWDKDNQKIIIANKNGFEVLTVWDSDYKKNKINILNKCLEFLGKK